MVRAAVIALVVLAVLAVAVVVYVRPRGRAGRGALPTLTSHELRVASELQRDVERLAGTIGERNVFRPAALHAAEGYLAAELAATQLAVGRQTYPVDGVDCSNLEVEITGGAKPQEVVVIAAHYDSVVGSPGADDNATGVAVVLALARRFAQQRTARTLRFVFFVNEEPPHFLTDEMGSYRYAKRSAERGEKVVAMLSIESVGYYDDRSGSQKYPPPLNFLYPSRGNFIGFVSNLGSRPLLGKAADAFRRNCSMPFEAAAAPTSIPGVGWSDQWAFWEFGYPAVMVTDTAIFRDPHYHTAGDLPGTVDFQRMTLVLQGLAGVVDELANEGRGRPSS